MARMTFTVPESLKAQAQAHREVNWSAIVAGAIAARLEALKVLDDLAGRSRLTEADVAELASHIDRKLAAKLRASSSSTPTDS